MAGLSNFWPKRQRENDMTPSLQVPEENRCEIPSEMLGDFFSLEGGEQANTKIENDGAPR